MSARDKYRPFTEQEMAAFVVQNGVRTTDDADKDMDDLAKRLWCAVKRCVCYKETPKGTPWLCQCCADDLEKLTELAYVADEKWIG